jgi:adenylate cyclase
MARRRSARRKRGKSQDATERLTQAAETVRETGRRINRDPTLLSIVRSVRKALPGEGRVGDTAALSEHQPRAVGKMMAELTSDHPGVLGEAGLGALQVWQSISEAQGRGRGKKELAIAFTDLVDFSEWALEAGDEVAIDLLREVSVAIEPPVKDNGGKVVKRLGDGMMAVFSDPAKGLDALLTARERIGDVDLDGYRPRMRAGMHVGRPRKVGKDYVGVDVNIAARVADGAGPDELLISNSVLETVGRDKIKATTRELLDAKGVPEDFAIHAVKGKTSG